MRAGGHTATRMQCNASEDVLGVLEANKTEVTRYIPYPQCGTWFVGIELTARENDTREEWLTESARNTSGPGPDPNTDTNTSTNPAGDRDSSAQQGRQRSVQVLLSVTTSACWEGACGKHGAACRWLITRHTRVSFCTCKSLPVLFFFYFLLLKYLPNWLMQSSNQSISTCTA